MRILIKKLVIVGIVLMFCETVLGLGITHTGDPIFVGDTVEFELTIPDVPWWMRTVVYCDYDDGIIDEIYNDWHSTPSYFTFSHIFNTAGMYNIAVHAYDRYVPSDMTIGTMIL